MAEEVSILEHPDYKELRVNLDSEGVLGALGTVCHHILNINPPLRVKNVVLRLKHNQRVVKIQTLT